MKNLRHATFGTGAALLFAAVLAQQTESPGLELIEAFNRHQKPVSNVAFSPNGKWVASSSDDQSIQITGVPKGQVIALTGHTGFVEDLAVSPDGALIASASTDRTVRVWESQTGDQRKRFPHPQPVASVAFSPNGQLIASASADRLVRIWNLETEQVTELDGHKNSVTGVAFSANQQFLTSVSADQTIILWDAQTFRRLGSMTENQVSKSITVSPDSRLVVTTALHTVRIWDVQSKQIVRTLTDFPDYVARAKFSPDGRYLVTATGWCFRIGFGTQQRWPVLSHRLEGWSGTPLEGHWSSDCSTPE
jgi:WD40 repeat protein